MTVERDDEAGEGPSGSIERASVQDVVRSIRDCKEDDGRGKYSFLIGAGVSKPAGIPTSGDLIDEWQTERYGETHPDVDVEDVPESDIEEWVEASEAEEKCDEDDYGFWFEQLHTTRGERRHLIREKVEDKEPTFGIIVLAALMEAEYVPLVLTPNFDDLLYDALYRFLEEKPLVVDHDAVAEEFRLTRERPAILKLHGDYLYDNLQNTNVETKKLKKNIRRAFSLALNEYGLVVIGYGGNDESIMRDVLLNDEIDIPEYGVYWCARTEDGTVDEDGLSEDAVELLRRDNTFLVPIEGSESFFTKLGNRIPDVDPPTDEDLKENAEKKIEAMNRTLERRSEEAETEEEAEYVDALQEVSRAQEHLKDEAWEKAIDVSTGVIENRSEDGPAPAYRIRAYGRYKQGNDKEAIEDYTTAIELDPENSEAYLHRGIVHANIGSYEKAIEDYTTAIELDPENSSAYTNRGIAHANIGSCEKAIEDHSTAIDLDPENSTAYNNRGTAHKKAGQYQKAIEDHSTAIDLDPENSTAYNNRGTDYWELSEYETAIEDYTTAIDLDPENVNAYLNRSEARIALEDYQAALQDAHTAYDLAEEPGDVARALMLILIAKVIRNDEFDEDETEYREVCSEPFTTTWSFDELESWLESADVGDEKADKIREIMDLLRDHIGTK